MSPVGVCAGGAGRLRRSAAALAGLALFATAPLAAAGTSPSAQVTPPTCAVPDPVARTGRSDEAVRASLEVPRADPTSACALAGLAALRPATPRAACDVAADLRDAGDVAAARAVLEEEVKATGSECARLALARLQRPSWTDRVATVTRWVAVGLPVLAALALVLLWPLASVPPVGRWLRRRAVFRPQVAVGPFDDPGDGGPKPAAALAARVSEELAARADDELPPLSLSIVDKFQELDTALAAVKDLDAALAPLPALARLATTAVRARRWAVTGALRVVGGQATVTGQLREGGRLAEATTFCVPAPPVTPGRVRFGLHRPAPPVKPPPLTVESFTDLAVPLAGWMLHRAAADLGDPRLLSTTPTSYAWLCAGIAAQEKGDSPAAAACYRRSLDADPRHLRAEVARAIADADTASPADAVAVLQTALDTLDRSVHG